MDLATLAKNVGAVLGTASVIAYVYGYLALRARALVLGTEPAFKLVDEVYVFAGFRVLFTTAVLLLLSAPALLLIRWLAAALYRSLPSGAALAVEWALLTVVAIMTLTAVLVIFSMDGLLLQQGPLPTGGVAGAALGAPGLLRTALMLAMVVLLALTALWLASRGQEQRGALAPLLVLVLGMQLALPPIYHGALLADRNVRVLTGVPEAASALAAPLAVVDRTGEEATLLGANAGGERRLVNVKREALMGVPVGEVMGLHDFLSARLAGPAGVTGGTTGDPNTADGIRNVGARTMAEGTDGAPPGLLDRMLRQLSITLDRLGSLGDSVVESGEAWIVALDESGRPGQPHRLSAADDLAWPVVGADGTPIFALRGGRLVRIQNDGQGIEVVDDATRWRKLLGVGHDGSVAGLAVLAGETRPAIHHPQQGLQAEPGLLSEADRRAIATLLQENRAYEGDLALVMDRSERGGRGFDVYLRTPEGNWNVSDCGDRACGQASLSTDRRHVVFVRAPLF